MSDKLEILLSVEPWTMSRDVVLYESAPRLSLADKFFLCRYLTETAGVIMPPPRIREIGIKCLTVTVLQQHRFQSILEHLEGEDWMYELARLEASLLATMAYVSLLSYCYRRALASFSFGIITRICL
ncbi:unnamed protein product [Sphenostylis stenocarpa]|uniref:Uncharacterized protein n=1 Tax=Sphenostylis stenocarpa TaxID=92480 RepID=A0AA86VHW4_9FABA|nr:unnamed protein product [Sphenostylis stenocarpa]